MALISVHIEPDIDYTGTYTVKVFAVGNLVTPVLTKTYNPPFTGDIDDILTITGYKDYVVKIYANECSKEVGSTEADAPDFCGVPRTVYPTELEYSSVVMRWGGPLEGLTIAGYKWELYLGSTLVQSGDTTAIFLSITGLTQLTNYTFKLYTKCSGGLISSGTQSNFTTPDGPS